MGITAHFKSDIDGVFNLLLKEIEFQLPLASCTASPLLVRLYR